MDGRVIMLETLKAMEMVFPGEVSVLSLGRNKDDSSIAVTGKLPDLDLWKSNVPKSLRFMLICGNHLVNNMFLVIGLLC